MDIDLYYRYFKYLMKSSDLPKLYKQSKEFEVTIAQMDEICIKHICKAIEILDMSSITSKYLKEEMAKQTSHYIW